jgi:hypothetical protein
VLAKLRENRLLLTCGMPQVHNTCEGYGATASLLQTWIDEIKQRTWFLNEIGHTAPRSNS